MSGEKKQDKQHTYDNWRAITESDFVTLFIKTWFAFVATLRELYPQSTRPYYQASGDAPYLSSYKAAFSDNLFFLCKYELIEQNLISVYRYGLEVTCKKYPRFLIQDFYRIMNSFRESYEEQFESAGGYHGNLRLTVRHQEEGIVKAELIYPDHKLEESLTAWPMVVSVECNYHEILDNIIKAIEKTPIVLAENELIDQFYTIFFDDIKAKLIHELKKKSDELPEKGKKQLQKVYLAMISFCNRGLNSVKATCLQADISENHKLLVQAPVADYVESYGSLSQIEKQRAFLWFVGYAYRLRNALFHEIIDPLDSDWQSLFKNAYLVLKQIVDSNIKWLETTALLKKLAPLEFENDFRNLPPPDIPIEQDNTTFSTEHVDLIYFNETGAKVSIGATIICKGISYHVECNVKWDEKLKTSKVKNVQISAMH